MTVGANDNAPLAAPGSASARMIEAARRSADEAVRQTNPLTQKALIRCAARYIEGAVQQLGFERLPR